MMYVSIFAIGLFIGICISGNIMKESYKEAIITRRNRDLLNVWLNIKISNHSVADYFKKYNYNRIVIYGAGYLGELLFRDLTNDGVDILYFIDKNADDIFSDLPVYKIKDNLPDADVVVVTPINYFDEINVDLNAVFDIPIVALDQIIYSIM